MPELLNVVRELAHRALALVEALEDQYGPMRDE